MRLLLAAVAIFVLAGCGGAKWPTDSVARTQVHDLLTARFGAAFVREVPWCVPGVDAHEYECKVAVTYRGGGQNDDTTWFIKCDPAAKTCRLES